MAYYALLNKDNIVVQVITGVDENEVQIDIDGTEVGGSSEAWEKFYESLPWFEGLKCKRTSYNTIGNRHNEGKTPFRGNFAGINSFYDENWDVFIPPKPVNNPSFILDYNSFSWIPPVPRPENGEGYYWRWSELNKEWVKILDTSEQ